MGSIVSGISGYFSKYLILGTFLPVVIFVILSWLFAIPLFPPDWPILKPLEALDTQWKLLAVSFVTIVLTGILYNVNIPLIRIYEGYPWKEFWIGQWRTRKYKRLFKIAEAQWKGLPFLEFEFANDPRVAHILNQRESAGRQLFADFPSTEELVLPTALGNVIRSFESYPYRQYNMEAVTFWPRLVAKMDKDYAAGIQETKTSFDFMLNCSTLGTVLALITLLFGLIYPAHLNSTRETIFWIAEIVIFSVFAYSFYRLSIGRARAWGNTVRTAFDLYRFELLKQLGYDRLPKSLDDERELWRYIGERMIFGEHYTQPGVEYSLESTSVRSEPHAARFEILRGISQLDAATGSSSAPVSAQILVKISVKNVSKYKANTVIVTDTLPDGLVFLWDSASVANPDAPAHKIIVRGANRYHFNVGPLEIDHELVLSYCAVPFKADSTPADDEKSENQSLLLFSGNLMAYDASINPSANQAAADPGDQAVLE